MFNKDEKASKEIETVIGPSVKVKGDFISEGSLSIDGEFDGSIKTTGNVQAGAGSKIVADVKATNVTILGTLIGNLETTGALTVGEKANIKGDIVASALSVASGAVINGTITMTSKKSQEISNA